MSILKPPSLNVREIIGALRLRLSESDLDSFYDLEHIFYRSKYYPYYPEKEASKLKVAEVFTSSLYNIACKKYFAASNIHNELMFSVADQFLTEELIFSHIEGAGSIEIEWCYVKAMISSSHLSERILAASFSKVSEDTRELTLELTPDNMLTPEVVKSWLASARWGWETGDTLTCVAARVRKAHPEYEGFPDEWLLKVFCGE